MPFASSKGVDIHYDTRGESTNPTILLIHGLGTQKLGWNEEFCDYLVGQGFFVVRFDNRDVGESTILSDQKPPSLAWKIFLNKLGFKPSSPYSLADMAQDSISVLNVLNIKTAHVVGASMGGMIAQHLAANYPGRVLSLTSIMSSSGRRGIPWIDSSVMSVMGKKVDPADRNASIDYSMALWRAVASTAYPTPEATLKAFVSDSYERGYYPDGVARQFAAILADGDRSPLLKTIKQPTLVVHGDSDLMVHVEGGKDTARQIAGSRLEIIAGMGHDFPPELSTRIAKLVVEHVTQVNAQAPV